MIDQLYFRIILFLNAALILLKMRKEYVFTIRVHSLLFTSSVYNRMLVSFMLLVYILIRTSHQLYYLFYVLK